MTQRILITSALPYINGIKHLGNLAGSLLPADVHARFQRARGRDVLFVSGTDEHGTPAEIAAAASGLTVSDYCAAQHRRQAESYAALDIAFDHFSRTSGRTNRALTQKVFTALDARGLIEARRIDVIWSAADGRYLPDRYVVGTCPACAGAARGDQCETCGRLLDPTDLVAPRSAISGSTALERREVEHLFLRQSALREPLRAWLSQRPGWPPHVANLAASLVETDLRDRCITRDLEWGIPVPGQDHEGRVFWVWFDAPIGYLAAVEEWAESVGADARDWLDPQADVRWVQFLAKDNVPFHAVTFPASLIGSGLPYRTVDVIKGFHWLRHNGAKFSTSGGHGIFCDTAAAALSADSWRWWLTANAPESDDANFTLSGFIADVNRDLADGIGNFVHRLVGLASTPGGVRIPAARPDLAREEPLAREIADIWVRLTQAHEDLQFRKAADLTRELWTRGNAHLHAVAPWSERRTDPEAAARTVQVGFGLAAIVADALAPITPGLSRRVRTLIGTGARPWTNVCDLAARADELAGRSVSDRAPLVPRIEPDHPVWSLDQSSINQERC